MKLSKEAYVNRIAIMGHVIVGVVLLAAYLLELLRGSRSIGYILIFAALVVLPIIAEIVVYRRAGENRSIRYIMGIGYGVLYLFVLFTTDSVLAFVYIFPMYIIMTLFSDMLFCIIMCVGGFLGNVAYVIYYAVATGYTAEDARDLEIRLACMGLVGGFMIIATWANKKLHTEDKRQIVIQQERVQTMLEDVLTISDSMAQGIEEVTGRMERLGESVSHIHQAMGEVSSGSNETAESVQNQLERTEQIQNHIVEVKTSVGFIEKNISGTTKVLMDSKEQMDVLAGEVEKSMEANERVLEKMQELNEFTAQMNTIIETITSIANSTGMLALNASIEAARAGEAGRGFAVVADQISGLANQTKTATVNITDLIENINRELAEVSEAVDVVSRSNQANADSTQTVAKSFEMITEGAGQIGDQSRELLQIVTRLEEANADIVEKIQTISAITEEVSAHSSETYSDCESNDVMVKEITGIVDSLSQSAQKLRNMR